MNGGIRRVGFVILLLFVGLIGQLTYLQLVENKRLSDDPHNTRKFLQDISRPRGPIVSSDGAVLAKSVPVNDVYKYQRVYPAATAKLFAQVVGYQSIQFGSVGVEAAYSKQLAGRDNCQPSLSFSALRDCTSREQRTGTVILNLSVKAQLAAAAGLAGRRGSVVVLNVRTGGVVAAYSNPTFDPTLLVSHDTKVAQLAREFLLAAPDNPMLARAWRELYPPGSTFKTVTAATALTDNVDVHKQFPFLTELPLPLTTASLHNFGDERCGGSLEEGYIESCNTTFGQVGLDLGNQLATGVQRFGVNEGGAPSDLDPDIVGSVGPREGSFQFEQPRFAQAAIGQGPVSVTPIEMALVAEAVATGGVIKTPQTVNRVEDPDGRVVRTYHSKEWRRAMDPGVAATMRDWMIQVVNRGTGTAAQIPGIQVAGKTGTAETSENEPPHAWFIAFAPADNPQYAIAVLVEHGGSSQAETTGGRVAAPVAASVLRVLLGA
jgi:peptidoglycan glycosyltransferase